MHKDEYDPWVSGLETEQPLAVAHAHIPSTSRYISESLTIASEAMDKMYIYSSSLLCAGDVLTFLPC